MIFSSEGMEFQLSGQMERNETHTGCSTLDDIETVEFKVRVLFINLVINILIAPL